MEHSIPFASSILHLLSVQCSSSFFLLRPGLSVYYMPFNSIEPYLLDDKSEKYCIISIQIILPKVGNSL
jgi:hypothetical protein